MGRELYVRHISDKATEDDLRKLFSVSGTVTSVHLVTDPDSGNFMGCGFVRMANDAEARDAMETLDGALLVDRTILVSEARPQKQQGKPGAKGGKRPGGGFGRKGPGGPGGRKPGGPGRGKPSGSGKK